MYCKIEQGRVETDGKVCFEMPAPYTMLDFLTAIYEEWRIDYRRFYRMDPLSKLGFLAAEIMFASLEHFDREQPKDDAGIVFFNSSASLAADLKYYETARPGEQFYPSPADFVYTLPNIVLGEIAIRNRIHGETAFYVTPRFQPDDLRQAADDLLADGMKCVLAGWAEADPFAERADCYMTLYGAE